MSASSATLDAAAQRLHDLAGWVESCLAEALPGEHAWPATIHRAARYSLLAGGKRIRPLLSLAAADAVGGAREAALPFALAVELVHTYSLIHDDLPAMDNDDLRRGRPTCHKVFGEAIAILAGDALLTRAFHLLAELPADASHELLRQRLRAAALLGEAAGTTGLIGGQVEDLESEHRRISSEALERLHRAKTGALLRASVLGGALLGGATSQELEALGRYAAAIGLAFQVVDDVLDATESAEQLGKTAGKDQAAEKSTYVSVHGLERSRALARDLLVEALAALQPFDSRATALTLLAHRIVERRG